MLKAEFVVFFLMRRGSGVVVGAEPVVGDFTATASFMASSAS